MTLVTLPTLALGLILLLLEDRDCISDVPVHIISTAPGTVPSSGRCLMNSF